MASLVRREVATMIGKLGSDIGVGEGKGWPGVDEVGKRSTMAKEVGYERGGDERSRRGVDEVGRKKGVVEERASG
ncbi:hypothetical protein ACSBR1_018540 [Camellia fascicularis]